MSAVLNDQMKSSSFPSRGLDIEDQDDSDIGLFASSFDIGQQHCYEYASTLDNITALKSESERNNMHISRLTEENQQLCRERDSLHRELSDLRVRFNESKECLEGQIETTSRREHEMAKMESKWRAFVAREREEIQNGRIELEEERQNLERNREDIALYAGNGDDYVGKLADMRNEIENEREKYLQLKREHEIAKVKNEVALTTALRDVETTNREIDVIKRSSESQMREIMESNEMKTKMLQRVQIQLRESEQRLKQRTSVEQELRIELEQVQKGRDDIEGVSIDTVSQYEMKLKESRAECALTHSMLHASQNEVQQLRDERESANKIKGQLRAKVIELEGSLKLGKKEYEEISRQVTSLRDELKLESESFTARIHRESYLLKKEKDISNERCCSAENDLERTNAEFQAFRRDMVVREDRMRRDLQAAKNDALVQTIQLKKKIAELKNNVATKESESEISMRNLQQAIEVCRHDFDLIFEENKSLQCEYESTRASSQELNRQLTAMKEQLKSETIQVHEKQRLIDTYERKTAEVEAHRDLLLSQLEAKVKELEKAKANIESKQKSTKAMERQTQAKEREFKAQIQKEKRKADAYKEKALEAHARTLHAKQLLVQTPGE